MTKIPRAALSIERCEWSDLDDEGSEWRIFIGRKECQ